MAELLYQGHGSSRLTSDEGRVLYVDPYVGEGYDLPADVILVSHEHSDHNNTGIVAKKPGCVILRARDFLKGGYHGSANVCGFHVQSVPAQNKNHDPAKCVGFLIFVDGVKLYFSCDTSKTKYMAGMRELCLDYALFCTDGEYNMSAKEASECAALIGARHSIPIHTKVGVLFDDSVAESFEAEGRIILHPGETLKLD